MEKKSKILIIIFVIIGMSVLIGWNQFSPQHENPIKVGNSEFELPVGYHEGTMNKNNDVNITNGKDTLFLREIDAKDLNKSMNAYKEHCEKNNYTLNNSNLTINNIQLYKFTEMESGSNHYWFVNGNKGYSIYSWSKIENMDSLVNNLINSL